MRNCNVPLLEVKMEWRFKATVLNSPKSTILALYSTLELLKSSISESSQGKEICMHVIRPRLIISLNFPNPKIKHEKLSFSDHIWSIKTLKNTHKENSICLQRYSKTKREIALFKETLCWALTTNGVHYATPSFNCQEFLTVKFFSEIWLYNTHNYFRADLWEKKWKFVKSVLNTMY